MASLITSPGCRNPAVAQSLVTFGLYQTISPYQYPMITIETLQFTAEIQIFKTLSTLEELILIEIFCSVNFRE